MVKIGGGNSIHDFIEEEISRYQDDRFKVGRQVGYEVR